MGILNANSKHQTDETHLGLPDAVVRTLWASHHEGVVEESSFGALLREFGHARLVCHDFLRLRKRRKKFEQCAVTRCVPSVAGVQAAKLSGGRSADLGAPLRGTARLEIVLDHVEGRHVTTARPVTVSGHSTEDQDSDLTSARARRNNQGHALRWN